MHPAHDRDVSRISIDSHSRHTKTILDFHRRAVLDSRRKEGQEGAAVSARRVVNLIAARVQETRVSRRDIAPARRRA